MGDDRQSPDAVAAEKGLATIEGTSMLPTLRPGDEVVVDLRARGFRCGDVIVVRDGETLVVHRVLGVGQTLETRGDNAPGVDAPVAPEQVTGPVIELRRMGRVYSYLTLRRRLADRLLGELSRRSLARPRIGRLFRLALRCFT